MMHRIQTSVIVLAIAAIAAVGCDRSKPPPVADLPGPATGSATRAATGTVIVKVAEGDETSTVTLENVPDGTTLESLMRTRMNDVEITGSGTTAFVHKIGEQATGGSEGWTFSVDGEWSERGIGQTVLHPPVTIEWKYGSWDGS